MLFIKLSVLDLYDQLFERKHQKGKGRLRKACMVMMGVVTAHFLACFFTTVFTCNPVNKNWDPNVPGGCMDSRKRMIATAGINLVIDMVIAALPIPEVWRLHLNVRRKVLLCLVFGTGVL